MKNSEIAELLYKYADLQEASGDNPYRVRAYRRAARSLLKLDNSVETLIKNNFSLTAIPWIGKGIAYIILEIIKTKKLPEIARAPRINITNELTELTGLGKARIKILQENFNIRTKKDLLKAIQSGKLLTLTWLNDKLIKTILSEIKHPPQSKKFLRLYHTVPIVELLLSHLNTLSEIKKIACVGDFRRRREIVEKLIFIINTSHQEQVINKIKHFNEIRAILQINPAYLLGTLYAGIQVEFRMIEKDAFGAALLYYTGSQAHLKELTLLFKKHHYNFNQNGLFKNNLSIQCENEVLYYQKINLDYIEPELREGRGEISAGLNGQLPQLIEIDDIKGDLHCHTNETDGTERLETMAQAALAKGYQYLAITDHSKRLVITNGMDEKRLLKQIKQIDKLNARLSNIIILKSIEVDILEDGTLDLSNDVLKELDLVVGSIHSRFKLPEDKQTERILKAMDNPYFNILGHATGRLIKSRPPYPINIKRILEAAKNCGCFIELNAQPYRLDIHDVYAKMAKEKGVKIAISSDAHSIRELNYMQFGIFQARRGWLSADDVINTRDLKALKKLLKRK